jgi:hypothetical protein
MDARDFVNDIQIGMKGLREFEVQIQIPTEFKFFGSIPFDMNIVNDQAFVTVKAESFEQAMQIAKEYFDGHTG